jgi:hypothetical protein
LGTGLVVSCAAGAAMDEIAMATAKAALMTADLTAFCWLVVPECRPRQGSVQRLFDSCAVPSGGQASRVQLRGHRRPASAFWWRARFEQSSVAPV